MRIAVAGGGIAGLSTAIALAQRGFSVDLLERNAELEEIGAGIQLSPNAMAALDRLGVLPDIQTGLVEPRAIELRDAHSGRFLTAIPLGETARRRYGAPYCVIHRVDLQHGLLAAARRRDGIRLHLGAEVRDVGAVQGGVAFNAGGHGSSADILVGADGIHSRLRTDYFGHPGPHPLRRTAWRATLPAADAPQHIPREATGLWLGRGAHLVHYPVRAGTGLNIVIIGGANAAQVGPPTAAFGALARELIEAVPAWSTWPLLGLDPARPWVKERVVLLGDAAHAMLPSAAQGGAQAIEDAWVLAACLAAEPDRPENALTSFESIRRPRVERIASEARRNLKIYELPGFAATLRNSAIHALPARFHLRRLDWLYGWRPE